MLMTIYWFFICIDRHNKFIYTYGGEKKCSFAWETCEKVDLEALGVA